MWEGRRERRPSWGDVAVTHRVPQRPAASSMPTSPTRGPCGTAEDAYEEETTDAEDVAGGLDDGAAGDAAHDLAAGRQPWGGAALPQRRTGWTAAPSRPPPLTTIPTATATASTARSHSPAVWVLQDDDVDALVGGGPGTEGPTLMESSSLNNNSLSQGRFSGSLYSDPNQSQRTAQLQRRWATEAGSLDDVRATQAPSPRVLDNRVCAFSRASSASAAVSIDSHDSLRPSGGGNAPRYGGDADADAAESTLYSSGSGAGARRVFQVPMTAPAPHGGGRRGGGAQGQRGTPGVPGADPAAVDAESDAGEREEDLTWRAGSVQGQPAAGGTAAPGNGTLALPTSPHGAPAALGGRALRRSAQPAAFTSGTVMDAHGALAGAAALPPAPVRPEAQPPQQPQRRRRSSASSATQSTLSGVGSTSLDASVAAIEPPRALRRTPAPCAREVEPDAGTDDGQDEVSSSPSEASSVADVEELYLPGLGPLLLLANVDTQDAAAAAAHTDKEAPASTTTAPSTVWSSSLEPYRAAHAMLQREADAHARERAALHARLEAAEQRVRLTAQQVGVAAEARAAELVQGYRADERKRRAQFQTTLDQLREENRDLTARLEAAARAPAMGGAAGAPSRSLWPASADEGEEAAGRRAEPREGFAGAVAPTVHVDGGGGALVRTSELSRQVQSVEAYWRDRLRTAERHWEDEMGRQSRQRREALDQVEELVRTVEQTQEELRYTRRQAARLREENTRLCATAAAASTGSDAHAATALAAQPGALAGRGGALSPAEAQQLRQALREHQHREAALLAQVESYGEEATRVRLRAEAALEKAEQELAAERRRSTEMVKLYGSQLESLHRQLREAKARNTAP